MMLNRIIDDYVVSDQIAEEDIEIYHIPGP